MLTGPSLSDLLEYTDWERQKWFDWLGQQGEQVLTLTAGPHGDGRFQSVGELLRHMFSAEKRYVERLTGRALSDTASVPAHNLDAILQLSQQSRRELRELIDTFPPDAWETPQEFKILTHLIRVSPKKIVTHILIHEIRHWAQIATLLRLNGLVGELHDFLFSPVL